MHGVNIAINAAGRFACPLPERRISPAPGLTLADSPQTAHRPGPSPRNGLSLARDEHASQRFHPGVNVPGLPLRIPTGCCPARSTLRLDNRSWFAPAPTASTPRTRCRISTDQHQPYRKRPLPFGSITSLGINASTSIQPVDPPTGPARFPFAPRHP
jgi:hypothetical protein